ncbi:gamma-glutamylcyclotransferase [Ochrobactrum sp. Q0168]|uniref:gamma-glutamylcyclotransferase n=1 Tax=Ochrobactrum sp. Q0168 TaxID=2793241 RepID=UPI0018EE35C3|nr:gamma-glutamylcyclotransferase [Ochrobactrum sp. Q0168]
MTLTEELVSLSIRPEVDRGPEPNRTPMSDEDVQALSEKLYLESGSDPLWVFAYGSLIWKPDFDAVDWRYGGVKGWHRSFCLRLTRWRGTRSQPGLMLALRRGGSCNGIVFRLSEVERLAQIQRLIRREISSISDASTIRWVSADTPDGPVRALTFWAGPRGDRVLNGLPLESVASTLARACGHIGSCAEYLYLTVKHLEEKGIHDRNLWKLQELVAAEIAALYEVNANIFA